MGVSGPQPERAKFYEEALLDEIKATCREARETDGVVPTHAGLHPDVVNGEAVLVAGYIDELEALRAGKAMERPGP